MKKIQAVIDAAKRVAEIRKKLGKYSPQSAEYVETVVADMAAHQQLERALKALEEK